MPIFRILVVRQELGSTHKSGKVPVAQSAMAGNG